MKFISLAVNPSVYHYSDPILPFLQQDVTAIFASLPETAIATVILARPFSRISEHCILILCGLFGLYRFGVWFIDYRKLYNCAGEIGVWLGISDAVTTSVCRVVMEHFADDCECDEPDEYKVLVVLAGEGSGPK